MKKQPEAGFTLVEIVLVVAVLCLIGFAGFRAYQAHQQASGVPVAGPKAASVNVWTAKGTDFKFSDAKNWSLGAPKNGQDLIISTDTVATNSPDGKLTDDLPNLTIGHLTITGQKTPPNGLALTIAGQPLTITGGIFDQMTAGALVSLTNNITLDGRQTVSVPARAQLSFSGGKLDTKSSAIMFSTAPTPQAPESLILGAPLSGRGTLIFTGQNILLSSLGGILSSPDFGGSVDIKPGALVTMFGAQALGSAAIQVEPGGTLGLNGTHLAGETLANDLTLAGNGVSATGHGAGTGATLGALSACLTSADEGCESTTVNLTGAVKLSANTELGQQPDGETPTTTYKFSHLDAGSYSIAAVPGSLVKISR